ncbi:NAD(P)-dependent alcohol dehydrogenase [Nocardia sp. NPDC056100]|uniref:NAD(P)-dependent alcohol dehydrogenase n=1 Tax=Nocardia sp. NPDC056100 TaxID=3345712 RepID=UPI0035E004E9
MRITAAVLHSPDDRYHLRELELAAPGPGQILVRIVATGYCHTDVLVRTPGFAPTPIITGHEGAGIVEAVGTGVDSPMVGDHVVLSYDACHECTACTGGSPAYCDTFFPRNLGGTGLGEPGPVSASDGTSIAARWFGQSSFATHTVVDARNAVVVARDLPLEMLAPLGCSVQTGAGSILIALNVRAGTEVVIFGAGAVGLSAVMAARVAGANTIVAVDLNPARLALAREVGATHAIDGAATDLAAQIIRATGGAHTCLDTTGVPAVITVALEVLRATGTCGLVGAQHGDLVLAPATLAVGRTLTGILEGNAVPRVLIPRLIELWRQGRFPFDKLVTTYAFEQINEAEEAALRGAVIKPVLLMPDSEQPRPTRT